LEPNTKIWQCLLIFIWILAIENPKHHFSLTSSNFDGKGVRRALPTPPPSYALWPHMCLGSRKCLPCALWLAKPTGGARSQNRGLVIRLPTRPRPVLGVTLTRKNHPWRGASSSMKRCFIIHPCAMWCVTQ
jgi:hypothetical protein